MSTSRPDTNWYQSEKTHYRNRQKKDIEYQTISNLRKLITKIGKRIYRILN